MGDGEREFVTTVIIVTKNSLSEEQLSRAIDGGEMDGVAEFMKLSQEMVKDKVMESMVDEDRIQILSVKVEEWTDEMEQQLQLYEPDEDDEE